jgi:ABC-type oligopeptide transport system substrate-binding subunit
MRLWNEARSRVADWVRNGRVDIPLDPNGSGLPFADAQEWRNDPEARTRLVRQPVSGTHFIVLNVATAPFDDVHVRRAAALALDREGYWGSLWRLGSIERERRSHLVGDPLEGDLLSGYAPYPTEPAIDAARREMAKSRYDTDGDGTCDAPVCEGITLENTLGPPFHVLVAPLRRIGLDVVFPSEGDAGNGQMLNGGWAPDWPSPSSVFIPLLTSSGIGYSNESMVGASPEQLRDQGYIATKVPSIDARVDACQALIGPIQTWCWARLDQFEVERLVALIPLDMDIAYWGTSERVRDMPFGTDGFPVLDAISVRAN